MDGLVDGGINEFWAVQIARKFHSQIGKDFRVAGQARRRQHGLHHAGGRIAVAAMLHLGDCRADREEHPSPARFADGVWKSSVDADANCGG
jgi:hypothetical protein